MIIIGIAGHPSSGKDTSAEYIASKGFFHISLGDILREEMKKLGMPIDRPSIREFVTAERKIKGSHYPTDIACERVNGNTIMTGFRNLAEVDYVRNQFGENFVLVGMEAPLRTRYERILGRKREGDNISFKEFKEHDEAERNNNPESHEVDNVLAQANYIIENTGMRPELYRKIDTLLDQLKEN